jgi:hypothetical protein
MIHKAGGGKGEGDGRYHTAQRAARYSQLAVATTMHWRQDVSTVIRTNACASHCNARQRHWYHCRIKPLPQYTYTQAKASGRGCYVNVIMRIPERVRMFVGGIAVLFM